jgi:hypothetical protein
MFQAPCRASAAMARVVPKGGRNDDGPHASLDSIGRPLSACNRPNLPFRFPAKIAHSASRPSFLGTRVLARPRAFSSALRPAFRANAARFRAAARFHVKVSPPRRSRAGARALGSSRRAGRWFDSHLILGTGVSGGAEVPALAKSPFPLLDAAPRTGRRREARSGCSRPFSNLQTPQADGRSCPERRLRSALLRTDAAFLPRRDGLFLARSRSCVGPGLRRAAFSRRLSTSLL